MKQRLERMWLAPGAKPKSGAARPVRVALLDGDAAIHTIFRDHLTASEPDWQLDTYTHGTPAWPALRATRPQLVLLAQTLMQGEIDGNHPAIAGKVLGA